MAFGKTKEEKKQHNEEKEKRQIEVAMAEYNLAHLDPEDKEIIFKIMNDMAGNGFLEFGTIFSGTGFEIQQNSMMNTLINQNWMIINQLSRINAKLEDK